MSQESAKALKKTFFTQNKPFYVTTQHPKPACGPDVLEKTVYFGYVDGKRYAHFRVYWSSKVLFLVRSVNAVCFSCSLSPWERVGVRASKL